MTSVQRILIPTFHSPISSSSSFSSSFSTFSISSSFCSSLPGKVVLKMYFCLFVIFGRFGFLPPDSRPFDGRLDQIRFRLRRRRRSPQSLVDCIPPSLADEVPQLQQHRLRLQLPVVEIHKSAVVGSAVPIRRRLAAVVSFAGRICA